MADWTALIRRIIQQHGQYLRSLQIGEEPNNPDSMTGGNGSFPNVRQAVVEGVLAAQDEIAKQGLQIEVGCNAALSFDPNDDLWPALIAMGGSEFLGSLDFVGLDFFPDVFRPLAFAELHNTVIGVLRHFRQTSLRAGNIPDAVPIRITENGWPTGPERPPQQQAEVLQTIIQAIYDVSNELNVTHYEFFTLRDGDSESSNLMDQWGLLRHDYAPKPAFAMYRRLIAEFGQQQSV